MVSARGRVGRSWISAATPEPQKCGVKNACSVFFVVFFFLIYRRNFRLILLPKRSWRRGHWSSMFPLKFFPTVGKAGDKRCWNEIPVVIITRGVLQLLFKSFGDFFLSVRDPNRLPEGRRGLNVCGEKPLSASLQSTPMSLQLSAYTESFSESEHEKEK